MRANQQSTHLPTTPAAVQLQLSAEQHRSIPIHVACCFSTGLSPVRWYRSCLEVLPDCICLSLSVPVPLSLPTSACRCLAAFVRPAPPPFIHPPTGKHQPLTPTLHLVSLPDCIRLQERIAAAGYG